MFLLASFLYRGHEIQTSKSIRGSTRQAHGGQALTKGSVSYTSLTSDGAWTNINEFAKSKYQVPKSVPRSL